MAGSILVIMFCCVIYYSEGSYKKTEKLHGKFDILATLVQPFTCI